MLMRCLIPVILVLTSVSNTGATSWLHKLVAHRRKIFLADLARLPPLILPPLTENNAGINTDAYPTNNLNHGREQTSSSDSNMQWLATGDEKSDNKSENKETNETKLSFKEENWTDRSSEPVKNISSRLNVDITVTVQKAPVGFVDSPKWDDESVMRLLMLIEVLNARPAKQAIRRALSPPTRRFYLPAGKNTFDLFPSWGRDHPNNMNYDDLPRYDDPLTNAPQDLVTTDDTVVYVSNPVEAHLPSSMITVKLLREIMEDRAKGLRKMPPTTRATYSWKSKTSRKASTKHVVRVSSTKTTTTGDKASSNGSKVNTTTTTLSDQVTPANNTQGLNTSDIVPANNTGDNKSG